jgi:hypothetical protein
LQEEFGKTNDAAVIEEDILTIGGVNKKGNIVTDGPRRRAFARGLEGLLALGVVIASLYGAIVRCSYLMYCTGLLTSRSRYSNLKMRHHLEEVLHPFFCIFCLS